MDKQTKKYRKRQFDRLKTEYFDYPPKLKIIKPDEETNWLDITNEELTKIAEILTK